LMRARRCWYIMSEVPLYRCCSKVRTHTAPGPYSRAMSRGIGPS
jgi:hypothetical protein